VRAGNFVPAVILIAISPDCLWWGITAYNHSSKHFPYLPFKSRHHEKPSIFLPHSLRVRDVLAVCLQIRA
jgi:hypothetical protein